MTADWALLEKANTELEAKIIKGMLEAQEIPVVTTSATVSRALSIPGLSVVQILVRNVDLERAQGLLEDFYAGNLDTDHNFDADSP